MRQEDVETAAAGQPGADGARLVLRTRVTDPERRGDLCVVLAHPMLPQADGSLGRLEWDSRRPDGQGVLQSLNLVADVGPEGNPVRWRAEYRSPRTVDEARAAAMHQMLGRLSRAKDAAVSVSGMQEGFTEYLARAAAVLGAAYPAAFAVHVPRPEAGATWRYLNTAACAPGCTARSGTAARPWKWAEDELTRRQAAWDDGPGAGAAPASPPPGRHGILLSQAPAPGARRCRDRGGPAPAQARFVRPVPRRCLAGQTSAGPG